MKITKLSILLIPFLTLLPQLADAQQMRTMNFDAGSSLLLQEFSAMLILEENQVKVELRIGRNEVKAGVDRLEKGDVILMMNGQRVKDIEGLRELYDGLEKDAEIKIGVRRGEERFILNAIKGDTPEGGPRMMMSFDTESEGVLVPDLGIILINKANEIVVEGLLEPLIPEELKTAEVQNYVITELNGKKPQNALEAQETIEALEVGAKISITFSKDGDTKSISFIKKERKGGFSIQTRNN